MIVSNDDLFDKSCTKTKHLNCLSSMSNQQPLSIKSKRCILLFILSTTYMLWRPSNLMFAGLDRRAALWSLKPLPIWIKNSVRINSFKYFQSKYHLNNAASTQRIARWLIQNVIIPEKTFINLQRIINPFLIVFDKGINPFPVYQELQKRKKAFIARYKFKTLVFSV